MSASLDQKTVNLTFYLTFYLTFNLTIFIWRPPSKSFSMTTKPTLYRTDKKSFTDTCTFEKICTDITTRKCDKVSLRKSPDKSEFINLFL